MIVLWLLSQAAGRKPDPLATLSGAAILVLLLNPLDLFSAGFVLSFSAMAGIMLLGPPLRALATPPRGEKPARRKNGALRRKLLKVFGKPAELVVVSLAAQAGVLLPVAETFHRVPLYGLLFNLLAVPLAGLLLPLYAVTLLVSLLPLVGGALGGLLGFAAARGSELLLWLVGLSQKLPFAQVRVPAPTVWAYAAFIATVVAVSRYVRAGWAKRMVAIALVGAVALAGAVLAGRADVRYHQLAVGQGDAALLIDGPVTFAIDVGPYGSEAANRLLAENRDLDALLLTHLHGDHVTGVAQLLAEGIGIRCAYLPVTARDAKAGDEGYDVLQMLASSGVPLSYLAAGDSLTLRTASITVQWPEADGLRAGRNENDDSLATLIRMGGVRILSMGDVSGLYERYAAATCDVLKVGHHGSDTGTGDEFLSAVRPAFAIVTCRDGAALPGAETMARLRAHGATALRTDETGEIIIEAMQKGYRVTTYKTGWMNGS
jgi:competence protein ComEC